ncbi:hypothetical protein [Entomospira culicis]|uniref:Uncharacterized protein n=1 Tax=Entomospira culicis TaxID=2719989 RepID=A0A968GGI8_9SPIO|nr:hypothetical protein [Entomospira culicis]NIZ19437.1 hypothetical protein [Entomospira culicis]NIZ69658.1 hypothetical protein [Entomospira culicis]WDI36769.1 hypothetical protein PVA46_05445 [Entomospira culicis]WDI38398.1 hypothetical protein PVA47_05455 [Entomospira culicis]
MYHLFLIILFITLATKIIAIPMMKRMEVDDTEWRLFLMKWGFPEPFVMIYENMWFWLHSKPVKTLRRENPEFDAELQMWLERMHDMQRRAISGILIVSGVMFLAMLPVFIMEML